MSRFQVVGIGENIQVAFTRVKDEAMRESGHGDHTGTIAGKSGFVEFTLPPRWTFDKFISTVDQAAIARWNKPSQQTMANRLLVDRIGVREAEQIVETYCDKSGPAIGVQLGSTESKLILQRFGVSPATCKVYGFCGWASC